MIKTPDDLLKLQTEAFKNASAAWEQAIKGAQKLADLNIASSKEAFEATTAKVQAMLAAKDPQAFAALLSDGSQASPEKMQAYAKDVYAITSETFNGLKSLAEQQIADAQKGFVSSIEAALANAPAGSETAVGFLKSALDAAGKAYAQAVDANKKLFDMAEVNLAGATKAATPSKKK